MSFSFPLFNFCFLCLVCDTLFAKYWYFTLLEVAAYVTGDSFFGIPKEQKSIVTSKIILVIITSTHHTLKGRKELHIPVCNVALTSIFYFQIFIPDSYLR